MPEITSGRAKDDANQLETAADQAIASCGGDLRATIEALIIANHLLETDHHLSFIYVANPILMP